MLPGDWRRAARQRLERGVDVLVVGGGITGAGILHDAAARGVAVGLVERGDFGSGTSSRSSKLVHGGLRYLRRLQLGITRTASRERDLLMEHNPHLVWPLRFLYPSYAHDPTPGWQVALGLTMYDHLSPVSHRHERIGAVATLAAVPQLADGGLEFGLLYDDAAADDARLVAAVTAAGLLGGGVALSYAEVVDLARAADGRVSGAVVRDLESGDTFVVAAGVVVNATGAWCDRVRGMLGEGGARLRPSRGSHLLFPRTRLPLEVAVTGLSPDDGRPIFAVPHPEGTLVGTTDLFHEGPLDDPRPSREEVAYLLRFVQRSFPAARLGAADVCGAFAGVRPILDSEAEDPSEASREEAVWVEKGLVSTAGGKLTTYRTTAAEVVDVALRQLPDERRPAARAAGTRTASLPWRGSLPELGGLLRRCGAEASVAAGLARRLGALALPLAHGAEAGDLRPCAEGLDVCLAELRWHLRWGGAVHLEDLFLRRTRLGMWSPRRCIEVVPRLRRGLRREAGWSYRRWTGELDRLAAALASWEPPELA